MTFLQSYVGMDFLCVYHHRCHSCRTLILSHVMLEWSVMYVITNVTFLWLFSKFMSEWRYYVYSTIDLTVVGL